MTLALPKALEPYRHSKCWVNWRFKAKGNGKFTKPPYQPSDPSKYADASDPATWGTFDEALANVERGLADGSASAFSGQPGSPVSTSTIASTRTESSHGR